MVGIGVGVPCFFTLTAFSGRATFPWIRLMATSGLYDLSVVKKEGIVNASIIAVILIIPTAPIIAVESLTISSCVIVGCAELVIWVIIMWAAYQSISSAAFTFSDAEVWVATFTFHEAG